MKKQTENMARVALIKVGSQKFQVIKVVRQIADLGLKESKELVDAVESAPQLIGGRVSPARAREIQVELEAAGAVTRTVLADNPEGEEAAFAEALAEGDQERVAGLKKVAQEQKRHSAMLALFKDKIQAQLQVFASALEFELAWFGHQLTASGIDPAVVPNPEVMVTDTPQGAGLSLVVKFQD